MKQQGSTLVEIVIVLCVIALLSLLLMPALESARQNVKHNGMAKIVVENEFLTQMTIETLANKPQTFWRFEYRFGEFIPAGRTVKLLMYVGTDQLNQEPWMALDQGSYDFIEAHKDLSLAEVVTLWCAEKDAKQK